MANLVRERNNGKRAYYNINTHLNPTNVCVYRCTFCAFRSDLRDPKGYVMSDEQILARGQEAVDNGCTEMHIVGGLHHQKTYDWYVNIIRILHDAYPQLHLKAWTAVEINWFEFLTKKSVREILEDLIDAGLGSMPGGGAEIFHPEVRDQICEHKADAQQLARHSSHGPRTGPADQLHDALRPHRKRLPPHRSPDPAARAAGRDGRLSDLHPAGLPSREHGAVAHQEAVGRRWTCGRWRSAA